MHDEDIFNNAKEIYPQNYITKPFTDSLLLYAIELALQNSENAPENIVKHETTTDAVYIPMSGGTNVKLLHKDISYIQANGAYSDIYYD